MNGLAFSLITLNFAELKFSKICETEHVSRFRRETWLAICSGTLASFVYWTRLKTSLQLTGPWFSTRTIASMIAECTRREIDKEYLISLVLFWQAGDARQLIDLWSTQIQNWRSYWSASMHCIWSTDVVHFTLQDGSSYMAIPLTIRAS